MAKEEIKSGDIRKNSWGEYRIILGVIDGTCYYVEYNTPTQPDRYFYAPTHAAVSEQTIRDKWTKIGELPQKMKEEMMRDLTLVILKHGEAFSMFDDLFNRGQYDLEGYIGGIPSPIQKEDLHKS